MTRQYIRYANRKLYCKAESRYVTLPELVETIREGTEVNVTRSKTRNDLTDLTLRSALATGAVLLSRQEMFSIVRGKQ